jgi:hypothetical protein
VSTIIGPPSGEACRRLTAGGRLVGQPRERLRERLRLRERERLRDRPWPWCMTGLMRSMVVTSFH